MTRSIGSLAILAAACFTSLSASGQNIVMKDGRTITAKSLRRQGDQIIATQELPPTEPGKTATTGDFGYQLNQIERLDFPRPIILDSGPDLVADGKGEEVLKQLEPVVSFYLAFRDAPGSWWPDSALLKAQALAALGRDSDALSIAEQLSKASDPEIALAAQVQIALANSRKSVSPQAMTIAERALKEGKRPLTRAAASIIQGQGLLEKKDWENALLAYLRVPVFYPQDKTLLRLATFGSGRAYFGMDDFASAKATFNQVIETAGSSPEAELAKTELENVARREKALAPPK
jgi:tetratricopeptide (TPR) repeat protein